MITKLASFLGRKVHELVRPTEPVVDLQPHLRAAVEKLPAAAIDACCLIDLLSDRLSCGKETDAMVPRRSRCGRMPHLLRVAGPFFEEGQQIGNLGAGEGVQ